MTEIREAGGLGDPRRCRRRLRPLIAGLCLCGAAGCSSLLHHCGSRSVAPDASWAPADERCRALADAAVDLSSEEQVREVRLKQLDDERSWASVRMSCNVISQILVSASYSYDERLTALSAQSLRTPPGYAMLCEIKRHKALIIAGTMVVKGSDGDVLVRFDAGASRSWMQKSFDATLAEAAYAERQYRSFMLALARCVTGWIGEPRQELAIALLHIVVGRPAEFYVHDTNGQPVEILWDSASMEMGAFRLVVPRECSAEDERKLGLYLDVFALEQRHEFSPRSVEPRLAFKLSRGEWMKLESLFKGLGCRTSRRMIDH